MDSSIVVVEESHWKNDSSASTSKFESLVQINSIAIDISGSMEATEPLKHEHFSIRGFVAGMRKKDPRTCLPFASEGSDADLVDNLPPLFVPRSRWWQCSNCIPDIETKRTREEMTVATRCGASADSCQNVGDKSGLFLHTREKTGSKGKTDVRDKEAGNPCDMPEANPLQVTERPNNTTDASDMVIVVKRPVCVVDEPDNASSGSDGTFNALPNRRKPKLRSLADIMVEERNPTSDNPRTRSSSSGGMQVASTEMEAVLGPQRELDVPSDVAKATRSPDRKRKIAPGEDKGPLWVISPSAAAKRVKGLMLDVDRSRRRVEISDSESEGDPSTRSGLRHGARTQHIKPKKPKALDISRKMRPIHSEDGTAPTRELPQINAACSANLQKHAFLLETSFDKLGHAPSASGGMGPCFRNSVSGHQREKISNHSKSYTPEVGPDHDPLVPPRKSILGASNIRGKVGLDPSINSLVDAEGNSNNQASFRQHTGIPDLNEEFPEETLMTQERQLITHSEERSLPLHKTMDVSASCNGEPTREGERQLGISDPKNKENNMELGASEMDIVELLAKNQREKALENSRRHLLGINNSTMVHSALYVDGRPGMIDFPLANRRSGFTMTNGNIGVRQNIPMNSPQLNSCRLDMSKPEESQFRLFGSSTLSQQRKAQYSASTFMMAEPTSSTGAELLWSSTRENVPFHLCIPQKSFVQPSPGMGVHSFSDPCHKGKNISDMKGGKDKKAVQNAALLKEGRIRPISTSVGSLDPYSNDTIPAMQLLSLMDQRVVSGSSSNVGTKSFLNKSSPCNHHSWLNGKENQKFLGESSFSQNSHSKDFSGLRYGIYCSGESSKSKKASSNLRVQIPQEPRKTKATPLEGSTNLAGLPARIYSTLGPCTLNRNPADFSIPEARNEFTLSAKDFKSRKRNVSKEKSRMVNVEGKKRQRMRKDASGKEKNARENN